jgi:hypothetical protein
MTDKPRKIYEMIKTEYKVFSKHQLMKDIFIVEETEDRCKMMNQITGYKFNIGENLDPDIYYMKDRIKLRLLELERKNEKLPIFLPN